MFKFFKKFRKASKEETNIEETNAILYKKITEQRTYLNAQIEPVIIKLIKEFKDTTPCYLNVGDKVIVNKFNIRYDSRNGWDGGSSVIISTIEQIRPLTSPIFATIKDIYVDTSYLREKLEFFINDMDLCDYKSNINSIINDFINYLKLCGSTDNFKVTNKYCIYWSAKFSTDCGFNPLWGSSIYSFLSTQTEEAVLTNQLWQEEIDLDKQLKEAKSKIVELERKLKEIKAKNN